MSRCSLRHSFTYLFFYFLFIYYRYPTRSTETQRINKTWSKRATTTRMYIRNRSWRPRWCRGVRAIWNLPYTTQCYLLPLICHWIPVFDELCRRSINFMRVSHESQLINQIASYCIDFARCNSPMGLNILFCADRFQTNIDGILNGSCNYIVHSYYNRSIADVQLRASCFLYKLVSIRDSRQSYFGNVAFTKAELTDIINHICCSLSLNLCVS